MERNKLNATSNHKNMIINQENKSTPKFMWEPKSGKNNGWR